MSVRLPIRTNNSLPFGTHSGTGSHRASYLMGKAGYYYGDKVAAAWSRAVIFRRVRNIAKRPLLASACLSVRLSVRMEQLGSKWTDFREIWYLSILRKSVEKIRVSLKPDKSNGYFTWRPIYIFDHILLFLLRMRNVSDKLCRENQNTHFMFNIIFSENRAVHEIMWKNIVQLGRPQMTIWRMRLAYWIPKAINTHTEVVYY